MVHIIFKDAFFVGIEFGAQAYFIFEKTIDQSSHENEIYGELEAIVNVLEIIKISVHGRVEINETLRQAVNTMRMSFHGDFVLPHNPTTFDDAVRLYQKLPDFIAGENPQSVPKKVYLYPLRKLDPNRVFGIIRDISKNLISNVVAIMQELEDAREDALDLSGTIAARYFAFFRNKVSLFSNLIRQYKENFQSDMGPLLTQIRGNGREESELASYLQGHFSSPFSKFELQRWIEIQQEEAAILRSFVSMLRNVTFCRNRGEHRDQIMTYDEVVSLNFYFPRMADPVLTNMDNFLDNVEQSNINHEEPWFSQISTLFNLELAVDDILYFQESNRDSPLTFVWVELTPQDRTQQWPDAELKAFRTGGRRRHEETFIPPGPPLNLRETVGNETVTLQWQPPQFGADFIEYYEIIITERGYRMEQQATSYTYQVPSTENMFQITTPTITVSYDVYICGICQVGKTATSEILHHSGVKVRLVGGAEICSPRRAHSGRIEVSSPVYASA